MLSCCPLSPASGVLAVGGGDAPCVGPGLVTSSLSRSGAGTFCVVPPPGSAITWFRMSGSSIEGCDGMGRIVPTGPAITWFSKADGSGSGGAGGGDGLCTTGLTFGTGSACTEGRMLWFLAQRARSSTWRLYRRSRHGNQLAHLEIALHCLPQETFSLYIQLIRDLAAANLPHHIDPCTQVKVSQVQLAFHRVQMHGYLRRNGCFGRAQRKLVFRQQARCPVSHLLRRCYDALQVRQRKALVCIPHVGSQLERKTIHGGDIAWIGGSLDRLFKQRLDMFAQGQRLLIRDARQVARVAAAAALTSSCTNTTLVRQAGDEVGPLGGLSHP